MNLVSQDYHNNKVENKVLLAQYNFINGFQEYPGKKIGGFSIMYVLS